MLPKNIQNMDPGAGICEDAAPISARERSRQITSDRRRELYGLADHIARQIENKTEHHERDLLFGMIGTLLPGSR